MMDASAACGSQVTYDSNRFSANKIYQIGVGVCAAQLHKNGFKIISQRDFTALELLDNKVDENHKIDTSKTDHHEITWHKEYFKIK